MKRITVFLLSAVLILSACGASEGIEVSDAWARTATQGTNGAIYFVIQNHNADADELIGAASSLADAVEVHESKMDGDVMMMQQMDSVALAPSAKVEFMPGGLHVMLIGLKQDINAGDEVELTLLFANSPDLTVKAIVKDADGMDTPDMDHSE
ncbi:MAG TPA: copper chaperone PCu(A)C [Anaerolineales bacterium]|nr:copper chaperone PCu(A)C [Anaerolineales bacterium]